MRGYQKRVVYLKNPGSAIFEEAYFIIKESHEADDEKTIIDEANRIIEENSGGERKKKTRKIFERPSSVYSGYNRGLYYAFYYNRYCLKRIF